MKLFSTKKDKAKLVLVFDVRSSSVGGAMFYRSMSSSTTPEIIFSIREPITKAMDFGVEEFLKSTTKSLETVANKIYKKALGAPDEIFCILSSPWHISQTRVINFEKNTPFVFTSKFAENLINKEQALFEEEIYTKYISTGNPVKILDLKNLKTSLNGYEVLDPINKKTKTLEMHLFTSISPLDVLNKLENSIQKYFSIENINFSSFVLPSFTLLRDVFIDKEDFIFTDIGESFTDIYLVRGGVLRQSLSFPLGFGIFKALGSTFVSGHSSHAVERNSNPILNKLKKQYLSQFQNALAEMSSDIILPSLIYVLTENNFENLFSSLIKNEEYSQYEKTISKWNVLPISPSVFHGMVKFTHDTLRDQFVIIDTIYINRFLI